MSNVKAGEFATLSLSAHFKLKIDASKLSGAKVIASGATSLIVAFDDGSYFDATVITRAMEKLPENFDLRTYPEYLLKIRSTDDLSEKWKNKFNNARCELEQRFNGGAYIVNSQRKYTTYTLLNEQEITRFVIAKNTTSQILLVNAVGLESGFVDDLFREK